MSVTFLMLETRYQKESTKGKKLYSGSWLQRGREGMAERLSSQGESMRSGSKTAKQGVDLELPLEANVTFKGLLVDQTPYTKGSTTRKMLSEQSHS